LCPSWAVEEEEAEPEQEQEEEEVVYLENSH